MRIAPCLPNELPELTVQRMFRGAEYTIHVRQTGMKSMTVDGKAVEGGIVPLSPAGSRVQVEITL